MRIPIVLTVGLVLIALALAVLLSRSPLVLIRANSTRLQEQISGLESYSTVCQANETLPAGTSAIRIAASSSYGPKLSVKARLHGRILTEGSRGSEWVGPVAVPVKRVARTWSHVTICFAFGAITESTAIGGARTSSKVAARTNGRPLSGRVQIEYLRRGSKSWLSLAPSIARHMGLGNFGGGAWVAYLVMLVMAALIAVTSSTLVRDLK